MAALDSHSEHKMKELLTLIKWASTHVHKQPDTITRNGNVRPLCTARGTGLAAGIVNKRCKFSITTSANLNRIHLRIRIKGPGNQRCEEVITDLRQNSPRNSRNHRPNLLESIKFMTYSMLKRSISTNSAESSQDSFDIPLSDVLRIPIEYQCITPGHFITSYIPRQEGVYEICIFWDHAQIPDSPFKANIAMTYEMLNKKDDRVVTNIRRMWQKKVVFNTPQPSTFDQKALKQISSTPENDRTTIRAVLNRNSTVHRSLSHISEDVSKLVKQATVTKRRVLKKVIAKAGHEIVIEEADPPSSTETSQKSSIDEQQDVKPVRCGSPVPKPRPKKGFDFELSFESDGSVNSRISSPVVAVSTGCDQRKLSGLMLSKDDCNIPSVRPHKKLTAVRSTPVTMKTSTLLLPRNDNNFKDSPFKALKALKEQPDESQSFTNTNSHGTDQPKVKEHASLRSTKSAMLPTNSKRMLELNVHEMCLPFFSTLRSDSDGSPTVKPAHSDTNKPFIEHNTTLATESFSKINLSIGKSYENVEETPEKPKNPIELFKVHTQLRQSDTYSITSSARSSKRSEIVEDILPNKEVVGRTFSYPECTSPKHSPPYERSNTIPGAPNVGDDTHHIVGEEQHLKINQYKRMTHKESIEHSIATFEEQKTEPQKQYEKHKLRISKSLPTLSKNWQAFEIDPDDEMGCSEVMATLMAGQGRTKRATLGAIDLSSQLKDFYQLDTDLMRSGQQLPIKHSNLLIVQDANSIHRISPLPFAHSPPAIVSPLASPGASPCASRMSSRRSSLVKHIDLLQMVTEESSDSTEKDNSPPILPDLHRCATREDFLNSPHTVRIPTATIDKSVQTNYEDIKRETAWGKHRQHQRKLILSNSVFSHIQSQDGVTSVTGSFDVNSSNVVPRIKYDLPVNGDGFQPHNLPLSNLHEPNRNCQLLRPFGSISNDAQEPTRQSTVETTDSGICDDHQSIFGNSPIRIISPGHSPTSVLAVPRRLPKPKLISGHHPVTRQRYRGKIKLQPNLLRSNASLSFEEKDDGGSPTNGKIGKRQHKNMRKTVNRMGITKYMYARSVSTKNNNKENISNYKDAGVFPKRRVKFSKRVLLHRRSTSRTSSKNSWNSSNDSPLSSFNFTPTPKESKPSDSPFKFQIPSVPLIEPCDLSFPSADIPQSLNDTECECHRYRQQGGAYTWVRPNDPILSNLCPGLSDSTCLSDITQSPASDEETPTAGESFTNLILASLLDESMEREQKEQTNNEEILFKSSVEASGIQPHENMDLINLCDTRVVNTLDACVIPVNDDLINLFDNNTAFRETIENDIADDVEVDIADDVETAMVDGVQTVMDDDDVEAATDDSVQSAAIRGVCTAFDGNIQTVIDGSFKPAATNGVQSSLDDDVQTAIDDSVQTILDNNADVDILPMINVNDEFLAITTSTTPLDHSTHTNSLVGVDVSLNVPYEEFAYHEFCDKMNERLTSINSDPLIQCDIKSDCLDDMDCDIDVKADVDLLFEAVLCSTTNNHPSNQSLSADLDSLFLSLHKDIEDLEKSIDVIPIDSQLPNPRRCYAYGAALEFGVVNERNNFQVR